MATNHASKHNEAMTFIFNRLETVPRENIEAVVAGIYGDFCTGNGLPWPFGPIYPPTFPLDFNQIDLRSQILESGKSEELKAAAIELVKIVERQLPYNEFDIALTGLVESKGARLNAEDAGTLDDMVSVARQSHQLYFSNDGKATDFQVLADSVPGGNTGGGTILARVNWWKVLGCDCVGGMVGGPGGYAGASTISVIMQL